MASDQRTTSSTTVRAVRPRVLIIDDDRFVADALALQLDGYDCVVVYSAEEGLRILAADSAFDAIVCDVMMPVMTGPQLHAHLACVMPEMAARMIFVSGAYWGLNVERSMRTIGNPCLEKPCTVEALAAAVESVRFTVKATQSL